jgi:ATP-dependent DNA helicase RecG
MIEENMAADLQSATELYLKLKNEVFTDLKVALLHGKMKAQKRKKLCPPL